MENGWLSNIHYAMIGRVAAAFARFEVSVDLWLNDFAGVSDGVGLCLTGQITNPGARIDAFIAMARHFGADDKWNKPFEQLAKDVKGMAEQRNRAVHDVWELSNPATPVRLERTARREAKMLSIHVPTQKLHEMELNIVQLERRFNQIAAQLFAQLRASPYRLPSSTVS